MLSLNGLLVGGAGAVLVSGNCRRGLTLSMGKVKILKASAGSGKTYRLAYEYIKGLVSDPLLYRGTLAVTFTNKATEQMKRRIIGGLHALAAAPEVVSESNDGSQVPYLEELMRETGLSRSKIVRNAGQARTLILHDYSRFAVSTIDKFFQRVARAFFRELGLDLDYTVEIDRDWVLTAAADRLLERTATDRTLREAVERLVDERAERGLGWDVRPDILRMGKELFREDYVPNGSPAERMLEVYNEIVRDIAGRFAALKATVVRAMGVMTGAALGPADFKQGNRGFAGYLARLAESDVPLAYSSYFARAAEDSAEWYSKSSAYRERILALEPELMPLLREVREGMDGLLLDSHSQELVGENLGRSLLLAQLGAEVKAVAAERNLVMIHETAALIHRLVTGNDAPFIYEKVGSAYSRYMIDEFQDTSQKQWQNFVPLLDNALAENDGEPVMLIGDVKQSIYRWRGGDWRILGYEADEHFEGELAPAVAMDTNWRSERNIIDFNNGLMRRVVELDSALLAEFLASAPAELRPLADILRHSYEGFEQRCSPGRLERRAEGYVEVVPVFREQVAGVLADRVADILSRGYALRDIAVLVRSNGEARRVADALLEAGYAIVSQEALLLSGSPVVGFVMAVFAVALRPQDSVSRAQYNAFLGRPYGAELPAAECEFLSSLLRCALTEGFERIIQRYGLNQRPEAVSFLQALYQVIISYSKQAISDVQMLLDWWAENGAKKTVYLPSEQDAVTVMTVHKAKGLEFGCVVVPFCDWELLPRSAGTMVTTLWAQAPAAAGRFAELGRVPVNYKKLMEGSHFAGDYYRESVYAHVDNLNLLYVALTRAERELYVMYDAAGGRKSRVSGLIDGVLEDFTELERVSYLQPDGGQGEMFTLGAKTVAVASDSVSAAEDVLGGERMIVLDSFPSHDAGQRVRARWRSDRYFGEDRGAVSPRRYGVLMHRLFELLGAPEELEAVLARMEVAGEIASSQEREYLCDRALRALADPVVSRWFSPEWEVVHSERDIIAGGGVRRPDRVMTRGRERAVVVDYKFGALRKGGYQVQVAEYMSLLRGMGYAEVEGYLWFVELGEVERVLS